jgi:hypothetical protein
MISRGYQFATWHASHAPSMASPACDKAAASLWSTAINSRIATSRSATAKALNPARSPASLRLDFSRAQHTGSGRRKFAARHAPPRHDQEIRGFDQCNDLTPDFRPFFIRVRLPVFGPGTGDDSAHGPPNGVGSRIDLRFHQVLDRGRRKKWRRYRDFAVRPGTTRRARGHDERRPRGDGQSCNAHGGASETS